jgi:hypothetical protein
VAVHMEAPEERSLPALLAPALRAALIRLDRKQAATAAVRKALRALAGFVCALKMKHGDNLGRRIRNSVANGIDELGFMGRKSWAPGKTLSKSRFWRVWVTARHRRGHSYPRWSCAVKPHTETGCHSNSR